MSDDYIMVIKEDEKYKKKVKKEKKVKTVKSDKKEKIKILSWDVGIINLAYAVLEFDGEKFDLLDMDVIDVVDYRTSCCHVLRGGDTTCSKIAKYSFTINEQEKYKTKHYCKAHIAKVDYEIINANTNGSQENKIKCEKCKQLCVHVVKNTKYGWCDKHYKKASGVYMRRCVKKFEQSCGKQSLDKIGVSMFTKLDNKPQLLDVDLVLVELQPVLKNPTMKSVAMLLYSYFIIRGIIDGKSRYKESSCVRTVAASGKLKIDKDTTDKKLKGKTDKELYDLTKGLGVIYAKFIMTDNTKKLLDRHKKLDDMCDAYLQAIRYYYKYYGYDIPGWIKERLLLAKVHISELEDAKIKAKKTKNVKKIKNVKTKKVKIKAIAKDKIVKLKKTKKKKINDINEPSCIVIDENTIKSIERKIENDHKLNLD